MTSQTTDAVRTENLSDHRDLRLLVVIASYGTKNIESLRRIIDRYRRMTIKTDIVVLSEAPKSLGSEVRVVVGLPSRNPWSLPFAHKVILAESIDRYDLFAYSEDDMEVTEQNIQSFFDITPKLSEDEIAGFLRYELDAEGNKSLPDVHGSYHWKPESVRVRDNHIVAEFTNEHAAFYLVTQSQLRAAIASGGFLREPYAGRYDMLCTAATDIYTSCGFRKVICVSQLDAFLIHHSSNRYVGQFGVSLTSFSHQLSAVTDISAGNLCPSTILSRSDPPLKREWSKSYYEQPCEGVLELVPPEAETILSIGCGWGATEARLHTRGARVTAVPLDSIIGAAARSQGMEVINGSLSECLTTLQGRVFDCLIMTNLIHLLPDPERTISQCSILIRPEGIFVITSPNFESLRVAAKTALGMLTFWKARSFESDGIHRLTPRELQRRLHSAGLRSSKLLWLDAASLIRRQGIFGRLVSTHWAVRATSHVPSIYFCLPRFIRAHTSISA
jgi:SAM-dependent methyltransferase